MSHLRFTLATCAVMFGAVPLHAAPPKLDKETCEQLKVEQTRFLEAGVANDIEKGAEWAKANLTPERLREIEHYLMLDEQVKFGCREVKLTIDALRAMEAARRLEIDPNADPTAPPEPKAEPKIEPRPAGLPGEDVPKLAPRTVDVEKASDREPSQQTSGKPKSRPKPKPQDAYVPPPAPSGTGYAAPGER